jgi:ribose/xylose/arabinose/galactoside ABC-type transport system permease subunit
MVEVTSGRKRGPLGGDFTAREASLAGFIVLLGLVLLAKSPEFFSPANLRSIAFDLGGRAIVAAALAPVIIAGAIDVSVGAMLLVSAVVGGSLARAGVAPPIAVGAALATGTALGALNGALVTVLRLPPIIATLATWGMLPAAVIWYTGGAEIGGLPAWFREMGGASVGPLPVSLLSGIGALVLVGLALAHTSWGRGLYAVGSDTAAAEQAGIPARRLLLSAFVLSGLGAGLAAVLEVPRYPVIQMTAGSGWELAAITTVVVGGVSITGGRGRMGGVALGVLLLGLIPPALIFLKVGGAWSPAVQGLLVLVAILGDVLSPRLRARRASP